MQIFWMNKFAFLLKTNLIKMEIKFSISLSSIINFCKNSSSQTINFWLLMQLLVPFVSFKSDTIFEMSGSEKMISSINTVTTFLKPLSIFLKRQSILKMWSPEGILLPDLEFYIRVRQIAQKELSKIQNYTTLGYIFYLASLN